jgi:hypothetical protein
MIHDDSPHATSTRTTVNGNELDCWKFSHGGEHNATGRRVAAALPRDMDALRFVEATENGANLYLDAYEGPSGEMWSFDAPEGYEIVEVGQFHDGDLCVELERESA